MTKDKHATTLDSFRERRKDVTSALRSLGALASGLGAASLRERIDRDLVQKLEEDRFHLVVVGEFNHGKSSFVNALLGRKALPVGVTPTTAAIHHLTYAEVPNATIVFADKSRKPLPFEEVSSFAVGGSRAGSTNHQSSAASGATDLSSSTVDHLEVGYPAALLREGIVLVDTPGVNDLSHQRADITYSYIPRADAVLFLLDAGQILKESERIFLQEKLLKASRDKIIFVITKWDILSASEQAEALTYAKTQLASLHEAPVVYPVSAENALAGSAGKESGMPELVAYLTNFLAEERGRIQLGNALREGLGVCEVLGKGQLARKRALAMQTDELDRRIAVLASDLQGHSATTEQRRSRVREELASIKTGARKDLERFADELSARLPTVIDEAKREDLGKYLPAFLEDTFKKWGEAQAKELSAQLEALAEKTIALMKDDAAASSAKIASALGTEVKPLDVQVDTLRYDIGVGALFAAGLLGLVFVNLATGLVLMTAAPVLAFFLKDRVDAEYKKRAKEAGPAVIKAAAASIAPRMDEMIDAFGKRLDEWIVQASNELYVGVLEILRNTQTQRRSGEREVGAAEAELEQAEKSLRDSVQTIESLQKSVELRGTPEVS
jgi:small GTP-binding protein